MIRLLKGCPFHKCSSGVHVYTTTKVDTWRDSCVYASFNGTGSLFVVYVGLLAV